MNTNTTRNTPPQSDTVDCPTPERLEDYLFSERTAPRADIEAHLARCDACLQEADRLLDDRRAAGRVNHRVKATGTPGFTMAGGLIVAVRGLFSRPGPVFRSGARTIIHSDIIPLVADYVILELFNEGDSTRLKLEKGTKNGTGVNISLYINEQLSDNLQLQQSHSWDLGHFPHGSYSLSLDSRTVLKFELRE